MRKKSKNIILGLLVLVIGIFTIRLFVVLKSPKTEKVDVNNGISVLENMDSVDINKRENYVRSMQDKYHAEEERKKIATAMSSGNYKYAFKDVLISGDSMVEAISEYSILNSANIIAKVGAGIPYLNDNIGAIVSANPKILILHFGENQIGTTAQASSLINQYKKVIKTIQSKLPSTKICIDGMFPVEPVAYKHNSYLKNIDYYNNALKKMSDDVGVKFIDYTSLWKSFTKDYYDGDGMHPKYSFYTEQYLPYIAQEAGIGVK